MRQSKKQLGCWFNERLRTEIALSPVFSAIVGLRWIDLCNRNEKLEPGSDDQSRVCLWRDSSWLTVARVFPKTGARLLHHCFKLWSMALESDSLFISQTNPDISVVLPVSGTDRIPQFMTVLSSFSYQKGVTFEVIIAEEGETPLLENKLPANVRYTFIPRKKNGFHSKGRTLNKGCSIAQARHLLLHDADILVPQNYLKEIVTRLDSQWCAIRPIRLLFCLSREKSTQLIESHSVENITAVRDVMQNFPGGSVALRRHTYHNIGGMDERFVGWGGEDNEFLDRLHTTNMFKGSFIPAIHLWHPSAPNKKNGDRNAAVLAQRMAIPALDRVKELRAN